MKKIKIIEILHSPSYTSKWYGMKKTDLIEAVNETSSLRKVKSINEFLFIDNGIDLIYLSEEEIQQANKIWKEKQKKVGNK